MFPMLEQPRKKNLQKQVLSEGKVWMPGVVRRSSLGSIVQRFRRGFRAE